MNATLRSPILADYETIASWVSDAEACLRWAGPQLAFPFFASELPRLLSAVGGQSYCLADETAAPYGFGQHWVIAPGAVHLGRIIVSPELRGNGLGRTLCQQLIAKAIQSTKANVITLRVFRDNHMAIALYSSLGFGFIEDESNERTFFMKMGANPAGYIKR
jgi:ribosomal protein S18 acetylase RimI-like enzyme